MIRPMLAVPSNATASRRGIDLDSLVGTHGFDVKIDGVRVIAEYDGTDLRLTNRNGVDVTHRFPELSAFAPLNGPIILDGEVVAVDGSFESTAIRDKQTKPADVAAAMKRMPIKFIAFDILGLGTDVLMSLPYHERRRMLDLVPMDPDGPWDRTVFSLSTSLYAAVKNLGMEGVIAKQLQSPYQQGKRSQSWIKFKTTHRVTCIPIGYEKGTGARSHFGAMYLAMLDDSGTPVPVGRVGTGFNNAEINMLKARLDNNDLFVVEIECLNRTKTGQLRFPVYKGIRVDLSVLDAKISQLQTLPTC